MTVHPRAPCAAERRRASQARAMLPQVAPLLLSIATRDFARASERASQRARWAWRRRRRRMPPLLLVTMLSGAARTPSCAAPGSRRCRGGHRSFGPCARAACGRRRRATERRWAWAARAAGRRERAARIYSAAPRRRNRYSWWRRVGVAIWRSEHHRARTSLLPACQTTCSPSGSDDSVRDSYDQISHLLLLGLAHQDRQHQKACSAHTQQLARRAFSASTPASTATTPCSARGRSSP